MVSEKDAIEIINYASKIGVKVYLDGGWGVDALLKRQTRPHNDIDLFIEETNRESFIKVLSCKGFYEVIETYTTNDHTVWKDNLDRVIDLHIFRFSNNEIIFEGNGYPIDTFSGIGTIGDIEVGCINAEYQVLFHVGYEIRDKDIHDVKLLCETFNIPIPEQYKSKI
ncbi:MAG: aminoglycoside nucleotidyltransferase [Bacilli bacterium]|jgi:lincosamide nucleotidyltransferase A/C/D/E|nr:aminoglycoside nucleotidyltransferase [Bacilli bacterium]MDD5183433.1 aminoglycoside nucleotidyltransferase [Bacilli bacterium]